MAKIEDLIDQIEDPSLREQVASEVKELKKTKQFGLVFEEHIPETVSVFGYPVRSGQIVQNRTTPDDLSQFRVLKVEDGVATVIPRGTDGPEAKIPVKDLLVVKQFHEQVFCGLTPVGNVRRGGPEKPAHVVINGENFHALQVLTYAYAGKVDCIYIDPPYNTGDKSWKYNNRFVDQKDRYRHSKWLSFMEKRLRLARHLLKPDGVLVVTIDEHEVHHLGVLLEQLFPEVRRQMVTIVNNAAGVTQGGFSRVEEYALFVFFGDSIPKPLSDDLLSDENRVRKTPIWRPLNRYSGENVSASRRPGLVYPILIDIERLRIVGTGRTLKDRVDSGEVKGDLEIWRPSDKETAPGIVAIWPLKGNGSLSTWELAPTTLSSLVDEGYVRVRRWRKGEGVSSFSLTYVKSGTRKKVADGEIELKGREPDAGPVILGEAKRQVVPKTVWRRTRHDAGKWGSRSLRELLGSVSFDYAKSPYAILDTLRTIVGDKKDAVVVDFFAGSGTTLQSVSMLNAEDGGYRQCVLVTNNQVDDARAKLLQNDGFYQGDSKFEFEGICLAVTIPRVRAALSGKRDDKPIEGTYQGGRSIADGFEENVEFLRLDYLDPDLVELGRHFNAVVPILWMASGSVGEFEKWDGDAPWSLPDGSTYGVLFDEQHLAQFTKELESRPSVTHVWLVTNSEAGFIEMCQALPEHLQVRRLYWDYSRNFTVNGPGVLG
ncbi:MAG: site-specific DNA-methyltransferase [Acidimicrobiia bacterium]|nr:site-specific DNA-methyltransferase [Acidimicrobiia bacterium]